MTDTDEFLLQAFANSRDEKAFRALANRYLGLVFHTAMRRTNHRQLSEEISQNILCALAKKASYLAKNPDRLPAWLHRATLFESSNAMSAESSQQRRKLLQIPAESLPDDSPWIDALPYLDAAIDKLPDTDRRVVLLHFFENRSFPGIARSLGKSTVAVQKQSQRALEKLARLLRAKGVTLTATTVATGLSAEFAKAAPLTLVQSSTAAVLTGTATYSTTALTLMFAVKSKALIPLVVLLCALPLALQQVAISRAQTRIAQLQAGPPATRTANSTTTKVTAKTHSSNLNAWKNLAERAALMGVKDKRIELELRERLGAMSTRKICEKIDQIATWDLPNSDGRVGLLVALLNAAINKDPAMTLRCFEDQLANSEDNMEMCLVAAFRKWMKSDSSEATAWLDAMISSGKLECTSIGNRNGGQCHNQMMANLQGVVIADLLKSAPTLAIQRFKSLMPDQRMALICYQLRNLEPGTEAAFVNLVRQGVTEDQYSHFLTMQNSRYAEMAWKMVQRGGFAQVGNFLDTIEAAPVERQSFAGFAAGLGLSRLIGGENAKVTRAAVDEMREWLAVQAPQDVDRISGIALARNAGGNFKVAAAIVDAIYQESGNEAVLVAFLENVKSSRSVREQAAMATKITDENTRRKILLKLNPYLPTPSPSGEGTDIPS
ncbi:MAG: sigma-70 family RNA polymerase sigma factor, partial [Verrucomicrobia bacterium]|nr:sigma-70 family RNA polymerase sigma factor [Verrucomicrobiota bacterium]